MAQNKYSETSLNRTPSGPGITFGLEVFLFKGVIYIGISRFGIEGISI